MMAPAPTNNFTSLLPSIHYEPITIREVKITRLTYQPSDGSYVYQCGLVQSQFPYIPGPNVFANPRFPHAWAQAWAREKTMSAKYR